MIDVAVVGSLHLDIMVDAPRLPRLDETLMGSAWRYKCGGKGGNQAVAAARFGVSTAFGGQTGEDDFGGRLRANLASVGVDTRCVGIDPRNGSGMSVAISEADGEYGAVVVSGANLTMNAAAIAADWEPLWHCKSLLLQNEIPEAVNIAAARAARTNGARIVLNAAPARQIPEVLLGLVDVLVVNRVEAEMLSGLIDAEPAIRSLGGTTRDIILTRGGEGVLLLTRQGRLLTVPAMPVKLISSHGAGDCFCGVLAACISKGDEIELACRTASQAAGLFVSLPESQHHTITAARVRQAGG